MCAGRLYRLDMGGYNLSCAWPSNILAAFSQLDTLNLGSNTNLTVSQGLLFRRRGC